LRKEPTLLVAGAAGTSSPLRKEPTLLVALLAVRLAPLDFLPLEGRAYTPHRFLPLEG